MKVELTRDELTTLVEALETVEKTERHWVTHEPTIRAIDAKALREKLEFTRGPFLSPVA